MNLQRNTLWVAVSLAILGGPALAADTTCTVTPVNSIITEGQTLQLQATCSATLTSINWKMDGTSVTGDVAGAYPSGKPIYYTTPVGLGGSNTFSFTVEGTTDTSGNATTPDPATVVVKPSSAVVAKAAGSATPTTPVDATCGTANGKAVSAMPANGAQCTASNSKPALAISGPTSFTWSCVSLTGGAEASCSAVRGYTVTASAGAHGTVDPASQPVEAGQPAIVTVTPNSGYSASASGCGGTLSGNTFTTGPITANCTVNATFTNAPVPGDCGSQDDLTQSVAQPSGDLCTVGTASPVVGTPAAWDWTCSGTNGGVNASCSVPRAYTVTATAGANGTISPASKDVVGNTPTTFTVTPATGYAATVSGCGGSLSGSTYTTAAVTANCSVSASFAVQTASTTDPGIGAGLWVPPGMANRTVADQSGGATDSVSYVPGCLNGAMSTSSGTGCAAKTVFDGTLYGTATAHTVSLGGTGALNSGKQLVLRYKSTSNAGTSTKYIRTRSYDGGNVGVNMRMWLSADPTATYDSVDSKCKQQSNRTPTIITGPGYCPVSPNTVYYYGMEYDETGARRFQVDEVGADFL